MALLGAATAWMWDLIEAEGRHRCLIQARCVFVVILHTDINSLEGVETKAPGRAPAFPWRRSGMGVRGWETDTRLGKTG